VKNQPGNVCGWRSWPYVIERGRTEMYRAQIDEILEYIGKLPSWTRKVEPLAQG